jgi:hypothetical protein
VVWGGGSEGHRRGLRGGCQWGRERPGKPYGDRDDVKSSVHRGCMKRPRSPGSSPPGRLKV